MRRGRAVAARYLDGLVAELEPRGWRFVRLYRIAGFTVPLLWVYARGVEDVGIVVSAGPSGGGTWAFYETQRGRYGYLHPCGDVVVAAEKVDRLLKRRMFPEMGVSPSGGGSGSA
ncbi:hypothetical protein [Actinomadura macra]|uniref:hypothetical protein n=1 Tax=Actinomadura macra TaxID=46164 RepID=UPI0012F8F19E|nr:hypothetical protein [Actinomadura macra]